MSLLEVDALEAGYDDAQVLRGVSLKADANEIVAVIGPNGAGKSTLVNVLSGFDRPTQGHVLMEDRDVTRWSAHRRGRPPPPRQRRCHRRAGDR